MVSKMVKSKTLAYLWGRISSRKANVNKNLDKNRVKVDIENICGKYLQSSDDILEFEVDPKDLDYVVSIVEMGLISRYDIFQIDRTLFGAKLKEVELI
jgi:hypothetical protein